MNTAKTAIIDKVNTFSDDISDEMQIIEKLYALTRLEHSQKRCDQEGTISTDKIKKHFAQKRLFIRSYRRDL